MNSVILIGRLTRDPELRYIPQSQTPVATFTLAVDRPMSREKKADFIRITVFGKQAENCSKYLSKGRQAAVNGRIETGSYQNRNGETVYTTDVIANNVEFIGEAPRSSGGGQYQRENQYDRGSAPGYNNNANARPARNEEPPFGYPFDEQETGGGGYPGGFSDLESGDDVFPGGFSQLDDDDENVPF